MSAESPLGPTTGLLRRTLRRRWPLLLGCATLIGLAGALFATSATPTYTSSAEVLVRPLGGNAFAPSTLSSSQTVTVGLTTEANLVGSPQVLALAAQVPGSPVRADQSAAGSVVLNSQMIRVSYSASSPQRAQDGARAVAEAFLRFRRTAAEQIRTAEVTRLQDQIRATTQALTDASAGLENPRPAAGAAARAQVLTTRLSGLQQSLGIAEAEPTDPGTVVTPAAVPSHLQSLRPLVLAVLGGLALMAVALLLACWRTWVNDRVEPDDRDVAGLPVWSTLPSGRAVTGAARARRRQHLAEHYRRFRTVLVAELPAPCVLTLTGVDDTADLAEVAANLAACLRVGGFDATLVDCDPAEASLTRLLGLDDEPGLCDVLAGRHDRPDSLTTGQRVRVIPAGSSYEHGADLFAGSALADVVGELRAKAEYVVLVTPVLDSAVGLRCAEVSDAVVLIAVDGRTRRRTVEDALARSALEPGVVRGVVVARLPRRRTRTLPRRRTRTLLRRRGRGEPEPLGDGLVLLAQDRYAGWWHRKNPGDAAAVDDAPVEIGESA